MNLRGSSEPLATARKAPMHNRATSAGPLTLHWMRGSLLRVLAASASRVGVAWLAGRLPHSRANSTPATSPPPASKPPRTPGAVGTPTTQRLRLRASTLVLVVV